MPSEPIAAVTRALTVLSTFSADQHAATLAELARRTGYHKTTLLRILASLEAEGFVRRLANGGYRLGPELLRLGSVYQESFALVDHVRPVLALLTERTGESSAFYVPEDDARVCLCRCESPRSIRHHVSQGQKLPLDRGTAGRVLSAFLGAEGEVFDRVRRNRVVTLTGDRVPEVSAVCSPVFGPHDRLVGALQVSGPTTRIAGELASKIERLVYAQAAELTRVLGGPIQLIDQKQGNTDYA